ncbi:MAG: hypothetical protein V1688_02005 [bacterium]
MSKKQISTEDLAVMLKKTNKDLSFLIKKSHNELVTQIKETDARLSKQIDETDARLSAQIKETDARLSQKIDSAVDELAAITKNEVDRFDDRLGVVEYGYEEIRLREGNMAFRFELMDVKNRVEMLEKEVLKPKK